MCLNLKSWYLFEKASCITDGEKFKQSPKVCVITRSAKRACDIIKAISPLRIRAVKLFAKHMKLEEQVNLLRSGGYPIGVGTPNRILKLAQRGSLNFSKTSLIIFDLNPNEMSFHVLNMLGGVSGDTFTLVRQYAAKIKCQYGVVVRHERYQAIQMKYTFNNNTRAP